VPGPDLSSVSPEYHEFADVFSKERAYCLPEHRPYNLTIDLEPIATIPPTCIYSISHSRMQALKEFIDENLCASFICSSLSPHGAPILFICKKNGSLRLCVDFWGLNRVTQKDCYSLLLISDLLDTLGGAWIYTKINLCHAYHLVWIADGNEWKTTFCTRYSSYEWLVMPFRLSNAPTAFQRFMNNIFSDLLNVCVIVYLNDILIYSDDDTDHREHVKKVLCHLQKHGLYAKPEKCKFHTEHTEYLG
jgi:Reverse transcriptase (RNA-dependent DNA polymerase)